MVRPHGFLLVELMLAVFLFIFTVSITLYLVKTVIDMQNSILMQLRVIRVACSFVDGGDVKSSTACSHCIVSVAQRPVHINGKVPVFVDVQTYSITPARGNASPFVFSAIV